MKSTYRLGYIVSFSFLLLFLFPVLGFAADPNPPALVQCGKGDSAMCTFNDFLDLGRVVIDFSLVYLILPLSVLSFGFAGFKYITAFGNESEATKIRGLLETTVKGILLAFFAWLIVSSLFNFFVDNSFNPFK